MKELDFYKQVQCPVKLNVSLSKILNRDVKLV